MTLLGSACIEPFDGADIELWLNQTVAVPSGDGGASANPCDPVLNPGSCSGVPTNGLPPAGTHFELYSLSGGWAFHLHDFVITPVVDPTNPCVVEDEFAYIAYSNLELQGLHVSAWYQKSLEFYQSADSPGGTTVTDDEAGALYDADRRMRWMAALASTVKVVASYQADLDRDALVAALADVPAPTEMSAAANSERWTKCQAIFDRWPDYYVGSDRVLSLPLNGRFYGAVAGTDPRNSSSIGGASLAVEAALGDFDAMQINWQFDDRAQQPQAVLDRFPESANGYHYMSGTPVIRTRGVINVPMQNEIFSSIAGEAAVYFSLNRDDVQF